jgi:hypothetical protein
MSGWAYSILVFKERGQYTSLAHTAAHVTLGIALLYIFALVVGLFAARDGDTEFEMSLFIIH